MKHFHKRFPFLSAKSIPFQTRMICSRPGSGGGSESPPLPVTNPAAANKIYEKQGKLILVPLQAACYNNDAVLYSKSEKEKNLCPPLFIIPPKGLGRSLCRNKLTVKKLPGDTMPNTRSENYTRGSAYTI